MDESVTVREFKIVSEEDKNKLLQDIQGFMGEYQDPVEEVAEVIGKNMESAKVFEAIDLMEQRVGVAFLIRTAYERFQPPYHLAYIAVDERLRGERIGKALLDRVIEHTGGAFSLHVSPKNTDAIGFYETIGMRKKYIRMTMD
jgi:ribosomal protein S18 acetylase RimI-like enzyme